MNLDLQAVAEYVAIHEGPLVPMDKPVVLALLADARTLLEVREWAIEKSYSLCGGWEDDGGESIRTMSKETCEGCDKAELRAILSAHDTGATTGRFSCKEPNLANKPRSK